MDDGTRHGKTLKWATNAFSYEDCFLLTEVPVSYTHLTLPTTPYV